MPFVHGLLLIVGLALLVKGAEFFVRSAGSIAKRFGVSELVIGLTLVAVGTSLPELVAAIIASIKGESALVMGNIAGANVANITLIIGLAAVIRTIRIEREMLERDGYLAFLAVIMLTAFAFNRSIVWWEGLAFLVIFLAYTVFLIETSEQLGATYHIREFARYFFRFRFVTRMADTMVDSIRDRVAPTQGPRPQRVADKRSNWRDVLILVFSGALVVVGGNLLVDKALFFSDYFGLPPTLVGILMALGTTAPEMSVAITAARQNMGGMVIGNAVGSLLTNTFLILGIASVISPLEVSALALRYALPYLVGVTILLLLFKRTGWEVRRAEGIALLSVYVGFVVGYGLLV